MDLYNICAGFLKEIQKILGRSSSWSSPEIRFFNKQVYMASKLRLNIMAEVYLLKLSYYTRSQN